AHAFPYGDKPVGMYPLVDLMQAARPKYFKIRGDRRPQTEVQPGIVTREKAGLTEQGLGLCLSSVVRQNSSPDRAAIGFYALELDFDPVCLAGEVVSQQGWRFVDIVIVNLNEPPSMFGYELPRTA